MSAAKYKSAIEGMAWPAVPTPRGGSLLSLLHQLQQSERWTPEALFDAQREQAEGLLLHARKRSPYHAKRLAKGRPTLGGPDWRRLPLLTRKQVIEHLGDLRSLATPPDHGTVREFRTSGSTGAPVVVLRTDLNVLLWDAMRLREYVWNGEDCRLTMASIRADFTAPAPHGERIDSWGRTFDEVWESGVHYRLQLATDPTDQFDWLMRVQPHYLLTYPTNLSALLDLFEARQTRLDNLRQVCCVSETVSEGLRTRCAQVLGVPLKSNFSSREFGFIAIQCPDCGQQHVQSEALYVEVVDDAGSPCAPGQTGRVIITDLHNYAMPMIRYETGDYAEVGVPCPAGRGLLSLARVLGRSRNMLVRPDGVRYWPIVGVSDWEAVAPVRQFQCIQHSLDEIEFRLVVAQPLTVAQRDGLTEIIHANLRYPFRLTFTEHPGPLPRASSGKFEEFLCLV